MFEKLLSLMTISSTIISAAAARRFLSRLVVVLALTVVGAVLASAVIIMALCGVYCGLMALGLGMGWAIAITILLSLSSLLGVGLAVRYHLQRLKQSLPRNVGDYIPPMSSIVTVVEAFIAGLTGRKQG